MLARQDFQPLPEFIDKAAAVMRPPSDGDWYNEQGLLMCGKCNAPLEYIITGEKMQPIPDSLPADKIEAIRKARAMIIGTKHRVVCRCLNQEREVYKRQQEAARLEERYNECYGNSMHLANTTWGKDDGRCPYALTTLKRYVSKYREMRERRINLLLSGGTGTGKTFYALCVANNLMTLGYHAAYTSPYTILTRTSPYISAQIVINAMLETAHVIVCDGVDDKALEGKSYGVLEALIASAKALGVPMILNTSLEGDKLEKLKEIYDGVHIDVEKGAKG